ncbi:MAG: serine/threonine protein kinase [Pseudomonadota bacterium]|nr:serine/threonine protein kinase [Pseudomonadota bacterium]
MDLARLKSLLPASLSAHADVAWRRFVSRNREGDVNDFVASLHADGHLDADQLREVLASLDVTLTLSEAAASQAPANPHRLLGLLGKGAMGEVYIGRDAKLRRNVAIKRMDARLAKSPVLMTRFTHEVQITAQLDHPSIIPIYGLEPQADGALAYSMKLIRGRTLKQVLVEARALTEKRKRLPAELALPARLDIFLQVSSAVAHAHTRGVIHRDLKPDNIMVGAFQEVIVMDWGIARLIGGAEAITEDDVPSGRAERTQLGLAIGTPRYMSPEQAQGLNDSLDGRSDQYALGLLLAELVTLRVARGGKGAAYVLQRAAAGEKDPLTPLDPREKVPRELAAIVRRATQLERARRYPDVAALGEDVRRYLRDDAVLAEPDTLGQRMARLISHHRQTALAIGVGLGLLVVLTGALGVLAALGVREVAREAAAEREGRLGLLIGATSGQSRRMESSLLRYEGLLQGLATAAEARLGDPVVRRPYFLSAAFSLPGKAPPDLVLSPYYDGRISLLHPDVVLAPGVDERLVADQVSQVVALGPVFQDVHRRSTGAAEGWQGRLKSTGVPIVWSYVATESGFLVGYPGSGVYPDAYDPREKSWYRAAIASVGPHWEPATLDESGMGLLVTCTRALRTPEGALLGVAAVDITVGYLIDTLLVPANVPDGVEAWLVNGDGRVVVRSSLRDQARHVRDWKPPPFARPVVLEAVAASPDAGHIVADGTLWAWSALPTLGWTYLVSGDAAGILGG